jgi:hypothetical protein
MNMAPMIAIATVRVHGLLLVGWSVLLGLTATALFRRSMLSFRYWMGWCVLALSQLVAALFAVAAPRDAKWFGINPVGWVMVAFVAIGLSVAVQLSISISGHQRMLVTLAQECAELRLRVEELEGSSLVADNSSPARPTAVDDSTVQPGIDAVT